VSVKRYTLPEMVGIPFTPILWYHLQEKPRAKKVIFRYKRDATNGTFCGALPAVPTGVTKNIKKHQMKVLVGDFLRKTGYLASATCAVTIGFPALAAEQKDEEISPVEI
jgi:hypothetical protein